MPVFVAAKLHGIRVTAASVKYHGSVGIDAGLMDLAGILPFEQVHVVNLNNGARWVTYALPIDADGPTQFTLNGGGARLGVVGDECVVMTYRESPTMVPAEVVFLDESNRVIGERTYP